VACEKAATFFSMLKKDVSTQWNSTVELSQSGLKVCPGLDRLVVQAEFNKPGGVKLRRFRLSDDEWKIIRQLSPMLDVRPEFVFTCLTY
jgi:hypothetical protein